MMKPTAIKLFLVYTTISFCFPISLSSAHAKLIQVDVEKNLKALLQDEDTDDDKKITMDDFPVKDTSRGNRHFILYSSEGSPYEIQGTYYLSNCLQELTLLKEQNSGISSLDADRIYENPVCRINRMIRDYYWQGLTRRIDAEHLSDVLIDPKLPRQDAYYLYVSSKDDFAYRYFLQAASSHSALKFNIVRLPETITPAYINAMQGFHGLLPLALRKTSDGTAEGVPFIVPGGRFNEMYGWDSYFEALGLIVDGKIELAKDMVDNLVYEINHYGKILNANRTYYLTRSQPPFLTSMALAVYEALPKNEESRQWLKIVLLAAIKEYQTVWMDEHHITSIGLNRYYDAGFGIPPEVEPGHFDPVLKPYAEKYKLSLQEFIDRYNQGKITEQRLDEFFVHDRAVRESGHDTTYRWRIHGTEQCANFATVDLNALLYKYEIDIACILRNIFGDKIDGHAGADWADRARQRKERILKYLWDSEKNLFFDYYLPEDRRSEYISAATFYPLWACHPDDPQTNILSRPQADRLITNALKKLESPGGLLCTAKSSLDRFGSPDQQRQWEYPNGWPPHQMIVWQALNNYQQTAIADRLIYKWLYMITRNAADYNGTIPEKFDVVNRSHAVFAEYGNVGVQFSYMTREGFGWMNASYQLGLKMLSKKMRPELEAMIPPEWFIEE
jgi:alpha,alpha-trehalase